LLHFHISAQIGKATGAELQYDHVGRCFIVVGYKECVLDVGGAALGAVKATQQYHLTSRFRVGQFDRAAVQPRCCSGASCGRMRMIRASNKGRRKGRHLYDPSLLRRRDRNGGHHCPPRGCCGSGSPSCPLHIRYCKSNMYVVQAPIAARAHMKHKQSGRVGHFQVCFEKLARLRRQSCALQP